MHVALTLHVAAHTAQSGLAVVDLIFEEPLAQSFLASWQAGVDSAGGDFVAGVRARLETGHG